MDARARVMAELLGDVPVDRARALAVLADRYAPEMAAAVREHIAHRTVDPLGVELAIPAHDLPPL